MDHDDMVLEDWLDWLANPPRPPTPPEYDEIALAEFEREEEVVWKVMASDEFISGEVILASCPLCRTPCKQQGEHGLR